MTLKKIPAATARPLSWSLNSWPADVFPNNTKRARHLVNAHRDALIAEGALSRPGREIVVLGDAYGRWLTKQAARVSGLGVAQ
jgi:hypothetical protein